MHKVPRWSRQRARALLRWARKTGDAAVMQRAQIAAMAVRRHSAREIMDAAGCSLSQVYRVVGLFVEEGRDGLLDRRRHNGLRVVKPSFALLVLELVQTSPRDHGYERATWTRELLVLVAWDKTGCRISVRTMSRVLHRIGARRGRPKPTVEPRLSRRQQRRRLQVIRELVAGLSDNEVGVYEDEVDIHLNPHIGLDWMARGQQKKVLTPGKNAKAYVAGALNARDGRLTWVGGSSKGSAIFVGLLEALVEAYPSATTIYVILDNYGIHKSATARAAVKRLPSIRLVFLPPYSPDHNRIERLWQDLHSNVTRNHQYNTLEQLCAAVARWLDAVSLGTRPLPLEKRVA